MPTARQLCVIAGLGSLVCACERADSPPALIAAIAPVPVPVPEPAPSATPSAPTGMGVPMPAEVTAPTVALPPRVARTPGELPVPPSADPKRYAQWLHAQPRALQARIMAFCRANPNAYEATCGGIGPLHIPQRPSPLFEPRPGDQTYEQWSAALTPAQTKYLADHCTGEETAFTDLCGGTPLVVAFDGEPVAFAAGRPTAATPWIALDRDGDGAIDRAGELFGSDTVLSDGTFASTGFAALAALDANGDGRIDRADPAYGALLLWADRNGDGRSTPDELSALATRVESISLAGRMAARCDRFLDCEGERAALGWRDGGGALHQGAVIDVYLSRVMGNAAQRRFSSPAPVPVPVPDQ